VFVISLLLDGCFLDDVHPLPPEACQTSCSYCKAAAATRAAASSRGCGSAARPGSDVSTTQIVSIAGSAQASVPVDPECPNVFSEHPALPAAAPTFSPSPRGVSLAPF